jgi:hypothetical protein
LFESIDLLVRATDVAEGLRRHSSQFFGTGVIHAYRAESCGLKGMRIFVHPDAQLTEDYPGELVSVGASAGYVDRRIRVERELNYVHPPPPGIPQADGTKTPVGLRDVTRGGDGNGQARP